jgi:hypothetical protein
MENDKKRKISAETTERKRRASESENENENESDRIDENFKSNIKAMDSGAVVVTVMKQKGHKPTWRLLFKNGIEVHHYNEFIEKCDCELFKMLMKYHGPIDVDLTRWDYTYWIDAARYLLLHWDGNKPLHPIEETMLAGAVDLPSLIGLAQPLCCLLDYLGNEAVRNYVDNAVVEAFHKDFPLDQHSLMMKYINCPPYVLYDIASQGSGMRQTCRAIREYYLDWLQHKRKVRPWPEDVPYIANYVKDSDIQAETMEKLMAKLPLLRQLKLTPEQLERYPRIDPSEKVFDMTPAQAAQNPLFELLLKDLCKA